MTIAILTHPLCQQHQMGEQHSESPARLQAILQRLENTDFKDQLSFLTAPKANRAQLMSAHALDYIDLIFAHAPTQGLVWLDPDTAMNPYSLDAALHAAGAAIEAVNLVMQGQIRKAFCAVRPPGHHAERQRAMGFCLFNNVALAALHALDHWQLERVAIVDFDVHHGNGTQDIVSGDSRILFCSSFEHPFYPFSGTAENASNVLNLALSSGTNGQTWRQAVTENWLTQLQQFAPQLIIISAGFDGHRDDAMAHFNLLEADYAWLTSELRLQANISSEGRLISCLEGGYELQSLAASIEQHLHAMLEQPG